MVRICMVCKCYLGVKEPLENVSTTHGICKLCDTEMRENKAYQNIL